MTLDLTPTSKSQKSSDTSSSTDLVPPTPKLPFDPPRRRSSLAFSKILDSPATREPVQTPQRAKPCNGDLSLVSRPNIGRKRTTETPIHESRPIPGPAPQFEKVFQIAKANLQFDMHFAASALGSIASRLPLPNQEPPLDDGGKFQKETSPRMWRYSTAPKIFSAPTSDVREPLPDASPTLPTIASRRGMEDETAVEPTSSGFASPMSEVYNLDPETESVFPPLPDSSSPWSRLSKEDNEFNQLHTSRFCEDDVSDLTQPMTSLKVGSDRNRDEELICNDMDDSPLIEHLRRKSRHGHDMAEAVLDIPSSIFLSQSAKAAAECARAKRGFLDEVPEESKEKDDEHNMGLSSQASASATPRDGCPDPQLHHYMATHPCPDPFAHIVHGTSGEHSSHPDTFGAQPRAWGNEYLRSANTVAAQHASIRTGPRTTANGSPMPFARRNRSLAPHAAYGHIDRSRMISPSLHTKPFHNANRTEQQAHRHAQKPSEHFRPGWYYANEHPQMDSRPATALYSFSTAAAKATGESTAPDLRIRDSYRTDTLTPLARPQGRFRKNGFAATLGAPGSRRHPGRALPNHSSAKRAHGSQAKYYEPQYFENVEFRSSPPRPSTSYSFHNVSRKRGANDLGLAGGDMIEDEVGWPSKPPMRTYQSEELMRVDEYTRAAVRMSLFGQSTPDYQPSENESMRELSPNVHIWRKGRAGEYEQRYRKKRRPSYWDGDLEEVRMSPAGRAGIQSSPPISERSEVAELENTSSYVGSAPVDFDSTLHEGSENDEMSKEQNSGQEVEMKDTLEQVS